jgi:hypothetical protein
MKQKGTQFSELAAHGSKLGWDTHEGSFNACGAATSKVCASIPGAKHMQVADYQGDMTKAHPKWQDLGMPHVISHHVPVVGGDVVDFTARQFDPAADYPHVEPLKSYRKRWGAVHEIEGE